jgi:hypothetical protein
MCREEVIDDVHAVVLGDGTEASHTRERQGPDELTHRQLRVEVVEFGAGFAALQDGLERLAVLLNDADPQNVGGVLVAVVTGCAGGSAEGDPGQRGGVQGRLRE